MAAVKLGLNAKLYYNSATYATPTWVEVTQVDDLTEDIKAQKAPANDRSSPVNKSVITSIDLSWTGRLKNDESTAFNFLYEAILERATVDVLVLNGSRTTNGVRGFRADVQVHDMSDSQGRNDSIYHSIMLEPTDSWNADTSAANPVKAVLVTAGAATYANVTGAAMTFA